MTRTYSAETKAEAVGLALSIGIRPAARRLGIPFRTIAHWCEHPDAQAAILRSRESVAARLWQAVDAGTAAVLEGLRDPKARLGDKANALRVVIEAHALVTGGPTARMESLNVTLDARRDLEPSQAAALRDWIDTLLASSDDELRTWAAEGGLAMIRDAERTAEQLTSGEEPKGG